MGTLWIINAGETSDGAEAIARALTGHRLTAVYHADTPIAQYIAERLAGQCAGEKNIYTLFIPGEGADYAAAWRELLSRHRDDEAAVVVPPAVSRRLIGLTLELPPTHYGALRQDAGGINRLIVEAHRTVVAGTNDLCHFTADAGSWR